MDPNLNNDEENPYDFIFKQNQPTPALTQSFGSKNRQMLIFGAFVVVVLIVVMIVISVITSSGKEDGTEIVSVRAYQNEIERVLELGNKNAGRGDLVRQLATLELVLFTDTQRVSNIISRLGVSTTNAQLNQHKSSARDSALTQSLQDDNHDVVYEELVDDLITDYYGAVRAAEESVGSTRNRESLAVVKRNIEVMYANDQADGQTSSGDTNSAAQAQ